MSHLGSRARARAAVFFGRVVKMLLFFYLGLSYFFVLNIVVAGAYAANPFVLQETFLRLKTRASYNGVHTHRLEVLE